MSLPPRTSLTWSQEAAAIAEQYMNATAKFYNSSQTLQFTTKARVQHLRAPLDASSAVAWGTKRVVRLQLPLNATTGQIKKGWIVQITGGNDPTLALISLTVQSAINSSHAALRTVECISELAATPRVPVTP